MLKYTGLLIDMDDTLLDSSPVYDKALEFTSREIAGRVGIKEKLLYENLIKERKTISLIMKGLSTSHNRLIVFKRTLDRMGIKYDFKQLSDIEDKYWDFFMKEVKIFPEALETLDCLRDNGVKVIIISDGILDLKLKKIVESGLSDHIDDLLSSEEVGFEKPIEAGFLISLNKIQKRPEEAIMLGNNLVNDIYGAQVLGIRAGLFDSGDGSNISGKSSKDFVKPDFVITKYSDLLKEFGL